MTQQCELAGRRNMRRFKTQSVAMFLGTRLDPRKEQSFIKLEENRIPTR